MNPLDFFKCLADETRLVCLLLIDNEGELCVCELTEALDVSQPKISRHLSQLRKFGLVKTRKQDQWIYYCIHPELPQWARLVINNTRSSSPEYFKNYLVRLKNSHNRPQSC